jgi:hypothetical protein
MSTPKKNAKTTKKVAPKTATKKSTTKKAAPKTAPKADSTTISGKQVGRNILLVVDSKNFSKAFADKKDREVVLSKVEAYNKRSSIKLKKEILEMMQKGKTTEKQRKDAVKKTVVKETVKPKAVVKVLKEDKIAAAKALLEKDGYTVSKQAPKSVTTNRGGEY